MTRWRRAHAHTHTNTHAHTHTRSYVEHDDDDDDDYCMDTRTRTRTRTDWTGKFILFFSLSHTLSRSLTLSPSFRFFFFRRLLTGARNLRRRRRVRGPRSAGRRRLVSPRARRAVTQNRVRTAAENRCSDAKHTGRGRKPRTNGRTDETTDREINK